MKKTIQSALVQLVLPACLLACCGGAAVAVPAHIQTDEIKSDVGTSHSAEKEALPVRVAEVRTVNARNHKASRTSEAPAPGQGRKITVESTAYCLRGFTARGTGVEYGTIAVDPRVIPLGSKIYVPGYGWGRALDTGGAVRGNIIDIWLPTSSQCYGWGRRTVTITVFDR
jgi:resuscitation-promoting factor RpfB